jgi:hypothetical protein
MQLMAKFNDSSAAALHKAVTVAASDVAAVRAVLTPHGPWSLIVVS